MSATRDDDGGQQGLAGARDAFRVARADKLQIFALARPTVVAAATLIRDLAKVVDEHLSKLWAQTGMPAQAALVAVGGYGRGELFPHSDVDVLVLLPPESSVSDAHKASVAGFITACWDLGLEIGSAVRTVDECLQESARDVTIATSLLESRFVCGRRALHDQFRRAHDASLDPLAFFRAKSLELQQRHRKFEDTPYSLEPNVKESPGGLRDLQHLRWVARAAGLGRSWTEMGERGLATSREVKLLQRNENQLKLIRAKLHLAAARREDRLVFDLQTSVAEGFGFESTRHQRASEQLMKRYYWAAKAVTQLTAILALNIGERLQGTADAPMRRINDRFFDKSGTLEVASDDVYQREPRAILETFRVFQDEVGVTGLSVRTLRALFNARLRMDGSFRRDRANREMFLSILQAEHGQTHAFRLMNATSVLGRYLWVFRRIVGQMQHDLFHVYTVDQHILMVLRNVRRFSVAEHAHEYPFCSQLMARFERPYVLYVAALFHDIAKGRGGDHSQLGTLEVRRFCRDHGVPTDDAKLIELLVAQHLTMSHMAQKEDTSDPEVVERFVKLVKDERALTALYLLTVADIRGTSPKVWNAWKGKLLEDLYRSALRRLGGASPNLDAVIESRKAEARSLLALASQLPGTETELWAQLEVAYFMRHDASAIAWHARVLRAKVNHASAVVQARSSPVGEGLQVLVYAADQPELFARICGTLDAAGFTIQDAKVHTTRHGYALDTFQVSHLSMDALTAADDAAEHRVLSTMLEARMREALDTQSTLPVPSQGRISRRVRSFPMTPRVQLRPDDRGQRWVLSVSASDRSGLLYAVARVLSQHKINIHLARISTLGERVEDTFLVDAPTLANPKTQGALEADLRAALEDPQRTQNVSAAPPARVISF
jgi:[protein-PII] uridylyltransferase